MPAPQQRDPGRQHKAEQEREGQRDEDLAAPEADLPAAGTVPVLTSRRSEVLASRLELKLLRWTPSRGFDPV